MRQQAEHNWPTPSPSDSALYTVTEVGELIDELVRLPGFLDVVPTRNHPRMGSVEKAAEEAADVLIMLVTTVEHFGIDLEDAFIDRVNELAYRYSGRHLNIDERR